MQTPLQILHAHWGFQAFRPMQEPIIASVLEGRDTLALMPTGGGKSLTYQVPALAMEGVCIVVTPLIALMKDQVDRLRKQGLKAVAVHSGLQPRQIDAALDNCVYGDVKFLYVAPERVASEAFRMRVQRMRVCLLAVDEAHCISEWGYDFRPAYLRIAELRQWIGDAPVLALTASATEKVAADIMTRLKFAAPNILRSSFARPNLSYTVRATEQKNEQLLRIIRAVGGAGIVYMRTREGTRRVAEFLTQEGIPAGFYHGALSHGERTAAQEAWMSGSTPVMVATNAFGMGIDKTDVRYVVHYAPPDTLEAYYQEAGRAGRDGRRAYAVLLKGPDDLAKAARRLKEEYPSLDKIREIYEALCSFLQIGVGDGGQSVHPFNPFKFCAQAHLWEGTVRAALKILQQNGYMSLIEAAENPAQLLFCVSRDDLYKLRVVHGELDHFVRTILRLYEGVFTDFRPIDEAEIAHWSGYSRARVGELMKRLWQLRVIRYLPASHQPLLYMDTERLSAKSLYIAPDTYLRRQQEQLARFEALTAYTASNECRSVVLQRYFGDTQAVECGVCDNCLARRRDEKTFEKTLWDALQGGQCDPRALPGAEAQVAAVLKKWTDEQKISIDNKGKITIIG